MADREPAKSSIGRRIATAALTIPVLLLALLIAALLIPLPYLDIMASIMTGLFAYLLPAAFLTLIFSYWLWRGRRTRYAAALIIISSATVAGWIGVSGRMLAFAANENARVDAGQLFTGFSVDNRGPDITLPYTSHDGKTVSLSIWKPKPTTASAPVLVMTHGGGFAGGSVTEQLLPYARWLANQGYLVIGANYTLSSKSVHAWNIAEGQIACALAWAGKNAGKYGGDVSRLGMYGESAGGNLVINTSYKIAKGTIVSPCPGPYPEVRAVSTIYPALGILEAYDNDHLLGETGRLFDEQYLGGTPAQFPERYASVQSVNSVTGKAPPTLIIFGASDHLVPPGGTRRFVDAARKAGIPLRSIEVPFGEHGFDLVSGGVGAQVWRQATLAWFAKHIGDGRTSGRADSEGFKVPVGAAPEIEGKK